MAFGRWLIVIGIVLVIAGLLLPWWQKSGLGRLPGDFVFERGGTRFYLPLATCVLISALLSLLFWLFRR